MKHEDWVNSAQFSPDGQRVVTASWDNTARLWDATSGNPIGELMKHEGKINSAQFSPGSRKLLACDGGGIRGIISIEIVAGIDSELRKNSENPKLVLADYFDYVAGTSTGAMMAILIALGYSVDQLRDFYLRSGEEMFHKVRLWERFRTKSEDDKLSKILGDVIGEDTTLASEKLHTFLMMVLRNATPISRGH
jgi:WD40 repeat protein